MVAILDRIKKAEAAKAAVAADRDTMRIAAMSEAELLADLARLDALRGLAPAVIAQHAVFWEALRAGDIDAQRALDKHRVTVGSKHPRQMTDSELRAELSGFDAMQITTVSARAHELSNYA